MSSTVLEVKGTTSRYFELFFGSLKIIVNWKVQPLNNCLPGQTNTRGKNKPNRNEDG